MLNIPFATCMQIVFVLFVAVVAAVTVANIALMKQQAIYTQQQQWTTQAARDRVKLSAQSAREHRDRERDRVKGSHK